MKIFFKYLNSQIIKINKIKKKSNNNVFHLFYNLFNNNK